MARTPNERRLRSQLRALAEAAVAYDEAIRLCANDPAKMATFCTAQGDGLDQLYARWMLLARAVVGRRPEV